MTPKCSDETLITNKRTNRFQPFRTPEHRILLSGLLLSFLYSICWNHIGVIETAKKGKRFVYFWVLKSFILDRLISYGVPQQADIDDTGRESICLHPDHKHISDKGADDVAHLHGAVHEVHRQLILPH